MSKAEERAKEAYPLRDAEHVYDEERVIEARGYFIEGYHQAEKDNELTLEDMEIILNAFLDLCIEKKEQGKMKRYTDKEWCQEVLKRFKDLKK